MLTNARGLFDAASVQERQVREEFESVWHSVDLQDEYLDDDFPPGTESPERLHRAVLVLREWAARMREPTPGDPT